MHSRSVKKANVIRESRVSEKGGEGAGSKAAQVRKGQVVK